MNKNKYYIELTMKWFKRNMKYHDHKRNVFNHSKDEACAMWEAGNRAAFYKGRERIRCLLKKLELKDH